MKDFSYYVFLAGIACCGLWILGLFLRAAVLFVRRRRQFVLADMGKAMLAGMRGGALRLASLLIPAALFGTLVAVLLLVRQYQNASLNITLTYTEAAMGLNPNGSRYNMSDILSDEVLEKAYASLRPKCDMDAFRDALHIEPAKKEKNEDDADLIATQFRLSFEGSRDTGVIKAEDAVWAVARAYQDWFIQKYAPDFDSLAISFDDIGEYDYPDLGRYLQTAIHRVSAFTQAYAGRDASFISGTTKESFSSLQTKAANLESTGLETLNSYILANGLSKEDDGYMSRLRYSHLQECGNYIKSIRGYNVRLRAINRYDNDMATVVYIPTYDTDSTFYMSKTKIGIDHFSIDAERYSAAASETLALIMDQDYMLRRLAEKGAGQNEYDKADAMVESLKEQILELAEAARQTAQDYLDTVQYGYLSISGSDSSFLMEGICVAAAVIVYLFLDYTGRELGQLGRQAEQIMAGEKKSSRERRQRHA